MSFLLSEQDRGLEALSGAIQRQKLIGHVISDEVDEQNGKIPPCSFILMVLRAWQTHERGSG
jgi:hypothetical protein